MTEISLGKARADSVSADYFHFGTGEKTLVILPGLSVFNITRFAREIANEYSVFKDGFTVYVIDRIDEIPEKYTVSDMARDTASLIDSLGLRDIYLFGASQGGMIALEIAARRPELVKKLALCSTALSVSGKTEIIDEWSSLARRGDGARLYDSFMKAVYPDRIYRLLTAAPAPEITGAELDRFAELAGGTTGFDVTDKTDRIACPVLAAGARDDDVLGGGAIFEIIEKFKSRPDFESIIYDGYGHAAYDTAPDFRDKLYEFFIKD